MTRFKLVDDYLLPNNFSVGGWIYVLRNKCYLDDIYKVGMTMRSPEERAKELSRTGVPCEFEVIKAYHSTNPIADEAEIHSELSDFRISDNREFFKCNLEYIEDVCESIGLVERGIDINELSMNYDFISTLKAKDYSDQIIYDKLSIFGDVNHVKNFLILYAIHNLNQNVFSKRLSFILDDKNPKIIKNLDFDNSKEIELLEFINNNNYDKNKCTEL